MMKTIKYVVLCAVVLLTACATPKKFNYLQDLSNGQLIELSRGNEIRLKPQDKISIIVKSKDPVLSNLFNKAISSQMESGRPESLQYLSGYVVADDGTIDFPQLGQLPVEGKTRREVEMLVKQRLNDSKLLTDAVVTVDFANLGYNALGEFKEPGHYDITKERYTIIDAISQAGDLTEYGLRDNVMVVRQEGQQQHVYVVDLTDSRSLYASPAYYIQQNDMIYVQANKVRARQSTALGNQTSNVSTWISLVSMLTTVAVLIFK